MTIHSFETVPGPSTIGYGAMWSDYPSAPEDSAGALLGAQEGSLGTLHAKLVSSRALTINSVPCRAVASTIGQFAARERLCISGTRFFMVRASIPPNAQDADATRFLDSFKPDSPKLLLKPTPAR
ncbi:MAG: hypothetical protein IPF92_24900 [Myxococcales bacterium]|nr:hypothetical protein [Myxococcales bacterium]